MTDYPKTHPLWNRSDEWISMRASQAVFDAEKVPHGAYDVMIRAERFAAVIHMAKADQVRADRAEALVRAIGTKWRPIPPGSPELDGIRFLLGRPDICGDKKGTMATGYWCEEHKFWAWPYGGVKPTHYREIPALPDTEPTP